MLNQPEAQTKLCVPVNRRGMLSDPLPREVHHSNKAAVSAKPAVSLGARTAHRSVLQSSGQACSTGTDTARSN